MQLVAAQESTFRHKSFGNATVGTTFVGKLFSDKFLKVQNSSQNTFLRLMYEFRIPGRLRQKQLKVDDVVTPPPRAN